MVVKAMVVGSEAGRETEGEADRTMRGWDPPAAARTSGHRQGDPSPQRDDTHENAKRGPHSFIDRAEAVPATTSTTHFQLVMRPCRPACLGELRDGVVRPPLQQEDSAAAHHHLVVHHGLCLQLKRGGGRGGTDGEGEGTGRQGVARNGRGRQQARLPLTTTEPGMACTCRCDLCRQLRSVTAGEVHSCRGAMQQYPEPTTVGSDSS